MIYPNPRITHIEIKDGLAGKIGLVEIFMKPENLYSIGDAHLKSVQIVPGCSVPSGEHETVQRSLKANHEHHAEIHISVPAGECG